ncbi:MAG: maltose ABC transporter substrate-binding protein [Candidatus Eremiobacteraeota bacterium]|nr:maltose ABC transporter substrate-binding protein [Candidatus Eremiobacteraeota bacterium]
MSWRPPLMLLLILLLTSCSKPPDPNRVVLWTAFEGKELEELKHLVGEFEQESHLHVQVLKVPFDALQKKFLVAAPAGQGPDLLIGPQDWLGVFATAGLLEPVPDSVFGSERRADFIPVAIEAVTFEGKVYAVPLLLDCIALLRNTELAPQAPASLDELVSQAQEIQHDSVRGFYYQLNNFYFSWPFLAAHGAHLFDTQGGHLDPFQLGLDEPPAIEGMQFLADLRGKYNLVPLGATNDLAKSLFLDRKLAMTLAGPWMMDSVREAKIPYVVEPIPPTASGGVAAPFVGATGLMQSTGSRNPTGGEALYKFLTRTDAIYRLALAAGRAPADKQALERASQQPVVGRDIVAFAHIAEQGTPMPSHPAMNAVWEPMEQAIDLVSSGQVEPGPEMEQTEKRIVAKIRFMME